MSRDCLNCYVLFLLVASVRTSDVWADDRLAGSGSAGTRYSASMRIADVPMKFQYRSLPLAADFYPTEFPSRRRAEFTADPTLERLVEAPMLPGTNVWQRMRQYRSHGRICLLNLWESSGSSLSLQAGKHGDPYLQWTSRAMNPAESTRGLLDRLFSVTVSSSGGGLFAAADRAKQAGDSQSGTSTRIN